MPGGGEELARLIGWEKKKFLVFSLTRNDRLGEKSFLVFIIKTADRLEKKFFSNFCLSYICEIVRKKHLDLLACVNRPGKLQEGDVVGQDRVGPERPGGTPHALVYVFEISGHNMPLII